MVIYDEPQYFMKILKDAFETDSNFKCFDEDSV